MMVLQNLRLVYGDEPVCLGLREGIIASTEPGEEGLDMEGALAFPGLVNSHDHLEFNSFPTLGRERYANYVDWGNRIHATCSDDIARVLRIPLPLRVQWGLYKNLLGGVTTVVHHGPSFPLEDPLIRVHAACQSIHSVQLDGRWRRRLNNPRHIGRPCVIHIGEGTDPRARREIDRLTRWNALRRPLVGVHGVAMDPTQASRFKALVWCPQSNFFLLGRTARVDLLGRHTALLFGTDSTLTGDWSIWDHLRSARATSLVEDRALFDMLTLTPARIWGLPGGALLPGRAADLTLARPRKGLQGWDAFFALEPEDLELVIHGGRVRLADERWRPALEAAGHLPGQWSGVRLGERMKYVPGDLPGLAREIRSYDPQAHFPFAL